MIGRISRRSLISLLAGAAGAATFSAVAEEQKPSDRGIGGTGMTSEPDAVTAGRIGFMGTIRRFGSIYVNEARISYPSDVAVWINGEKRSASALAIGQVARTIARSDAKDRLVTDRIDVLSEVIGPVSGIDKHAVTVLGQRVLLGDTIAPPDWVIGTRIAVFGIRTASGDIVATLVTPAGKWPDQIVGTPEMQGWMLRIGDESLYGIGEQYRGRRVVVRGVPTGRGFKVSAVALDSPFAGRDVRRMSIETYVSRTGSSFRSGDGIEFRSAELGRNVPADENLRAVLNIEVSPSGGLQLDRLRFEGANGAFDGRGFSFDGSPGSTAPPISGGPVGGDAHLGGNGRGPVGPGSGPAGPSGSQGPGGGSSMGPNPGSSPGTAGGSGQGPGAGLGAGPGSGPGASAGPGPAAGPGRSGVGPGAVGGAVGGMAASHGGPSGAGGPPSRGSGPGGDDGPRGKP